MGNRWPVDKGVFEFSTSTPRQNSAEVRREPDGGRLTGHFVVFDTVLRFWFLSYECDHADMPRTAAYISLPQAVDHNFSSAAATSINVFVSAAAAAFADVCLFCSSRRHRRLTNISFTPPPPP